jgi:hypothetical protein
MLTGWAEAPWDSHSKNTATQGRLGMGDPMLGGAANLASVECDASPSRAETPAKPDETRQ